MLTAEDLLCLTLSKLVDVYVYDIHTHSLTSAYFHPSFYLRKIYVKKENDEEEKRTPNVERQRATLNASWREHFSLFLYAHTIFDERE